METSDRILTRLLALHPKRIDLVLDRIERLLAALDHPEARLAPVVHVAGTNGKGSVIAFLRAMLEAAGYRVQVYTSPHLVRFHERIRLADGPIAEPALIALLDECERANAGEPITFFEITTAAAFLAFAREEADILLLETGLGGRLDATNVVARPALTVIAPIALDHQEFLGDTLAAIAFEKAGILKPGVPAVIAPQPLAALRVIEKRAAEIGARLLRGGYEWNVSGEDALNYSGAGDAYGYPRPNLPGPHQLINAGTAIAAAEALAGFRIPQEAVAAGLRHAEWPARLQRLTEGSYAAACPNGWRLWLDGGHNPAAGRALAQNFASARDLRLVCGMMNTKDASGFLRPFAGRAKRLIAVPIPGEENALNPMALTRTARELGIEAEPAPDLATAIALHGARPGREADLLVCGSLYLAGRVLAGEA